MFLTEIVTRVDERVAELKPRRSELERLAGSGGPLRPFVQALRRDAPLGVIAECKGRSPSKGQLTDSYDPVGQARRYQAGGASAISVLTEPTFFSGSLEHLRAVRAAVNLPVLRKDFVRDPLQVVEARAAGADAVLLIVRIVDDAVRLADLYRTARDLGLDVLVEVHSAAELETALALEPDLIGVNNRDLDSFETRLEFSRDLRPAIPSGPLTVCESGIQTLDDVEAIRAWGYDAILVGESLMRGSNLLEEIRAWR